MDDRTLASWRMASLRLHGARRFDSPEAVVDGLLAVQAENHRQTAWAIACRTDELTEAAFARRFDDGAFLRTHVLRPTWHYVTPADIRWLLELTGPRILKGQFAPQQRANGLSDADRDRGLQLIADELAGGTHLTRAAIGERLADAGLPSSGPQLRLITAYAELTGLVCSGAMQGNDHTYALIDERAPQARQLDRDEALAELVLRYFTGHGPATERDLAYWATMTLTDVRAGLAEVADQLDHLEHDGRTYWFGQPPPDADDPCEPRGHLLLVLDEYHNGYQDSRGVLDIDRIVPDVRAPNVGMALVDTQMVGNMRRSTRGAAEHFQVGAYRHLDDDEAAQLHAAGERYAAFLGRPTAVEVTPAS
jgi:hypothetical protein